MTGKMRVQIGQCASSRWTGVPPAMIMACNSDGAPWTASDVFVRK